MTTLYHGSLDIVAAPEIRTPNRALDYGAGFYLTSSESQAEAWVRRKLKGQAAVGFVNKYHYDPTEVADLRILNFESADEAWLDFVMANRTDPAYFHNYDVVIGPVADDRVYAAFALYEARLLDKQDLIHELKSYKLVNQILIHTEKAIPCIKWIEAKEIRK